jgi:single-strand DNA-binding protein
MPVTTITFVGNLTADPQTRATRQGTHVTSLRVAVNHRRQTADGSWENTTPTFHTVEAWGTLAVNAGASLRKGDRVVVVGHLAASTYLKDGVAHQLAKVRADVIGADLQFTRAPLRRVS